MGVRFTDGFGFGVTSSSCKNLSNLYNIATSPVTLQSAIYDIVIRDCYFGNDSDSGVFISIAGSSSTGIIANCQFGVADISSTYIVEGGLIVTGAYDGGGLATSS